MLAEQELRDATQAFRELENVDGLGNVIDVSTMASRQRYIAKDMLVSYEKEKERNAQLRDELESLNRRALYYKNLHEEAAKRRARSTQKVRMLELENERLKRDVAHWKERHDKTRDYWRYRAEDIQAKNTILRKAVDGLALILEKCGFTTEIETLRATLKEVE